MQNIHEILKKAGVEIPEAARAEFDKDVAANYKTLSEFEKKLGRVESERDDLKAQLATATETLKGFEGVDIATIQRELADWKSKAENAEKDYAAKLEQRDFEDALRSELDTVRFSSEAAKRAVLDEIRGAGLKRVNGKIMGLGDLLASIKERDSSAFVDEQQEQRPRFSAPKPVGVGGGNPTTREEIMSIKDRDSRRAAIAANFDLFGGNKK